MPGDETVTDGEGDSSSLRAAASEKGGPFFSSFRPGRWSCLGILLCCLLFSSWVRIGIPLRDPDFLTDAPAGMMKSDPGLLYYFLQRIVKSGGAVPSDFRNDPRVEHPLVVDDAQIDTVSQEFPIAWAYLLIRPAMPLHVFAHWFMGIFASLALIGVFFLTVELTGCYLTAGFAAGLYSLMPGSYRTLGLILMREDFSIPFYALHLALLARACLRGGRWAAVFSALALAGALASWHAMGFIAGLEGCCILLWFLRTGRNPMAGSPSWVYLPVLCGVALAVPALRAAGTFVSLPVLIPLGLYLAHEIRVRWNASPPIAKFAALAIPALGLLSRKVLFPGGKDPYGHVWELMKAKFLHGGQLPNDPSLLSFDARIMWQGPFSTLGAAGMADYFGIGLLFLIPVCLFCARGFLRREDDGADAVLGLFLILAVMLTYFVNRLAVLTGILLPVAGAVWLRKHRSRRFRLFAMGFLLLFQAGLFAYASRQNVISWYKPAYTTLEYRHFLAALPSLAPRGEAIVADTKNSTAILSEAEYPIVLQPKWERAYPREALREFLTRFFQGSPEELRRLILGKFRSRYLLVDRRTLWFGNRYLGGIPMDGMPIPGTAAEAFMSDEPEVFGRIPGFQLLYRSPPGILDETGLPADGLRFYRLVE